MKSIAISRGGFNLAHVDLSSPLIVIGRSPSSDIVLRAPGISAVHFLIEWIGKGPFDPKEGDWILTDISKNHVGLIF